MRRTVHKVKLEGSHPCLEPSSSKIEYDARSSVVNGQQLMLLLLHELVGIRIELPIRANALSLYDATHGVPTNAGSDRLGRNQGRETLGHRN